MRPSKALKVWTEITWKWIVQRPTVLYVRVEFVASLLKKWYIWEWDERKDKQVTFMTILRILLRQGISGQWRQFTMVVSCLVRILFNNRIHKTDMWMFPQIQEFVWMNIEIKMNLNNWNETKPAVFHYTFKDKIHFYYITYCVCLRNVVDSMFYTLYSES